MTTVFSKFKVFAVLLITALVFSGLAFMVSAAETVDDKLYQTLKYRSIGPFRQITQCCPAQARELGAKQPQFGEVRISQADLPEENSAGITKCHGYFPMSFSRLIHAL